MNTAPTPHTLKEFDIVLSVTEAAINAQFMQLFLTPLPNNEPDGNPVDPPPPTAGVPEPEPEYLISHKFTSKDNETDPAGVTGWIKCPRVDFVNLSDAADKKRAVKVIFEFLENKPGCVADPLRGIPAYDPKYDSRCDYWVLDGEEFEKRKWPFVDTFNLNGHIVSFEAGLGRADIKDIMEKRFVHPEARDALEPGIRSDSLLASSLFCLFQNYQITSSFRVLDSTGNFIDGNKERAIRDFFMRRFAPKGSTAAGLDAQPGDKLPVAETNKGLPSPQNPFVLGYSITQLVPQPTKGIPVFNPINFQFSVTGSERRGFPTLNYLMLTETIPDRANVKKHADAGSFEKTFFDIIHADYVDSERGTPVFDAAIGISRRSFVDQYIVRQVLEAYAPQLPQFPGFNVTSKSNDTDFFGEENGKFRTKKTQKWESNKVKIQSSHWTEDTLGAWHYETWSGTLETSVSYHSDDTYALPVDGQRRLYIDVEGKVKTKLYVTNDILNTSFLNLDKCYDINYEFTYSQALIVSTSSNATWSVSKGAGSWPATEFKDGKTRLVMTNKRGGRGIFVKADGLGLMAVINWFDAFDRLGANNAICERTTAISSIDYTRLQESINKGLKGLTGALIMPAGNVLSYNGLSTDSQGNVFSLVNYKTVVGGSRSATSFK